MPLQSQTESRYGHDKAHSIEDAVNKDALPRWM
jgi:hypothetical protein